MKNVQMEQVDNTAISEPITTSESTEKFDSSAMTLKELEERKEMLVIWRRGEGFFPDD